MNPKTKKLGRGISSLIDEEKSNILSGSENNIQNIPLEFIQPGPWQARKNFDDGELKELADSIASKGVINPVLVIPVNKKLKKSGYYLIAGERRWRACQLAQKHEIPSIIYEDISETEAAEISLIENIQRQDLNSIEESKGFLDLIEKYKYSQEKIAITVGKSRSYIANSLRLLKLPGKVIEMIINNEITAGHARALIGNPDATSLAIEIKNKNLSVREVENLLKLIKQKDKPEQKNNIQKLEISELENKISLFLGLKVRINQNNKNQKSKIIISCTNNDQLNNIISRLGYND